MCDYLEVFNFCKGYFSCSHGLCQGDPLSPYQFIIVLEVLGRNIQRFGEIGRLKGVRVASSLDPITHQQYVDDTTIFWEAYISLKPKARRRSLIIMPCYHANTSTMRREYILLILTLIFSLKSPKYLSVMLLLFLIPIWVCLLFLKTLLKPLEWDH